MKRLLFLLPFLSFFLASTPEEALAQNTTCATRPLGDNSNACASTAFVNNSFSLNVFGTSVARYGVKCDGVTDDSTAMQNAITANAGKAIYVPYTGSACILTANLNQSNPPADVLADPSVSYSGGGRMPLLVTNTFQVINGSFLTKTFNPGDSIGQTLALEAIGTPTYSGNATTLYAGIVNSRTVGRIDGNYLAANFLATANPGTGGTGSIGVMEIDYNNSRQDNYGFGIHIAGLSNAGDPQMGILIDYNGSAVGLYGWKYGIWIRSFTQAGLLIDGGLNDVTRPTPNGLQVQSVTGNQINIIGTGAANNIGINSSNTYQNHMVIVPSTDDVVGSIVGFNHAANFANWIIQTNGVASFREFSTYDFAIATGVSIGAAGTGNAVNSQALQFRSRTGGGVNLTATIASDFNGSIIITPTANSTISLQDGLGNQALGISTGNAIFSVTPTFQTLTGYVKAHAGSILTAAATIPLTDFATQATNTVVGNATAGTAAPIALDVGSCSTAASALIWTTNTGFGCNTSITAASVPASGLTGTTLASGVITSSLTTVGIIGSGTWQATVIAGQYGGTGVANTGKTITIGASLTTTGAGAATLAFPASPFTYTFPGASQTLASLAGSEAFTNKDLTGTGNTFPTFNQNTTGSAAKWTTARNLAGNSVDGSANVAFANKVILQGTVDAGFSAAQFLGALGTGIVKNTTTTGVLSIASAGTDYLTSVGVSFTGGLISVGSSPLTANGTIALTVAGTSGGIPYFSSTSAWSSSALLAANALMIGGGAGAAPATTTTGTGVLTALGLSVSGSGSLCLTTSCAMVTPTLGVALATSINGLTISTTTGTFTLTNAKTLSISNTLTFAGTDGSTLNVGDGGTLASAAFVATGTSGATIPLLNGSNTYSGSTTFTGTVLAQTTTGNWSSSNYGKSMVVTTTGAATNPAVGIFDSANGNGIALGSASTGFQVFAMPALSDNTTAAVQMMQVSRTGVYSSGTTAGVSCASGTVVAATVVVTGGIVTHC